MLLEKNENKLSVNELRSSATPCNFLTLNIQLIRGIWVLSTPFGISKLFSKEIRIKRSKEVCSRYYADRDA